MIPIAATTLYEAIICSLLEIALIYVAITGVLFPNRSVLNRMKFDHADKKLNTAIDVIPGFIMKIMTCLNAPNLVHPSTSVEFSTSRGIPSKKFLIMNVEPGSLKERATMITPKSEFTIPNAISTYRTAISRRSVGNILSTRRLVCIVFLPLNCSRERAYPASPSFPAGRRKAETGRRAATLGQTVAYFDGG